MPFVQWNEPAIDQAREPVQGWSADMSLGNALIHEMFRFSRRFLPGRLYKLRDKVFEILGVHIKAAVQIDGIFYDIDTNNYHERGVLCFGRYEIGTQRFIAQHISNTTNGLVIDVGANIGLHTLVMAASRTSREVDVLAFEANPDMVNKLRRNLALNNYADVHVYPIGLSDRECILELGLPYAAEPRGYHNPGTASMSSWERAIRRIQVKCKSLDQVLAEDGFGWDRVKLMKLDVEGMEFDVLKGADKILRQSGPAVIVEYNKSIYEQTRELLGSYGYVQIGSLVRYGIEKRALEENILFLKEQNTESSVS